MFNRAKRTYKQTFPPDVPHALSTISHSRRNGRLQSTWGRVSSREGCHESSGWGTEDGLIRWSVFHETKLNLIKMRGTGREVFRGTSRLVAPGYATLCPGVARSSVYTPILEWRGSSCARAISHTQTRWNQIDTEPRRGKDEATGTDWREKRRKNEWNTTVHKRAGWRADEKQLRRGVGWPCRVKRGTGGWKERDKLSRCYSIPFLGNKASCIVLAREEDAISERDG